MKCQVEKCKTMPLFSILGLQEYIEAVSYYHYLKEGNLVTLTEITDDLHFSINEVNCVYMSIHMTVFILVMNNAYIP